jgi:hypothetical protein
LDERDVDERFDRPLGLSRTSLAVLSSLWLFFSSSESCSDSELLLSFDSSSDSSSFRRCFLEDFEGCFDDDGCCLERPPLVDDRCSFDLLPFFSGAAGDDCCERIQRWLE